ncbi:MAG: substrate-binding domain-containing protein, partial [Gammaproteobacteria bacterium]
RFGSSSFPTMIQALETTLASSDYTLLLSAPEYPRSLEPAILQTLLERGVDAVALLGAEQTRQTFSLLAAHRIPFVLLWELNSSVGDCIGFDERAAAALVVDHLADLGHRSIGFIGGHSAANQRARSRFRAVVEVAAQRGVYLCEQATIETNYGFREGFEAMQGIVRARAPITAVICGNDYLAAGALSALDRAGVEVPHAMSLASFNDNEFAPFLHPPLTTVRLPIAAIGEQAARYLIARLAGEQQPVPGPLALELIVRDSTGPAPAHPGLATPTRIHRVK